MHGAVVRNERRGRRCGWVVQDLQANHLVRRQKYLRLQRTRACGPSRAQKTQEATRELRARSARSSQRRLVASRRQRRAGECCPSRSCFVSPTFGGWGKAASLVLRNVSFVRSRSHTTVAGRVETVVTVTVTSWDSDPPRPLMIPRVRAESRPLCCSTRSRISLDC